MNDNMSPADVAAVVGNTDRNYGYPVFPYGGGFGNSGFGGNGDWSWIIILLILFGWGGNGNGGFGGFNNDYAWLSNGQKEIMQNTNQGFNTLHLSNQIDSISNGINSLSNQLCNCCGDITSTISNGFYNSEIAANNRQMADMQQNFALSTQLANASADNRLGIQDLKATVISENCSDREVLRQIGQDILVNQTANTQKIIDEIFRDRLDEKNDKIADLQRQLQMADFRASQIAQTAQIRAGQVEEIDQMYNRLATCPVNTIPVYGNQRIFECNNGCGCGNNGFYGNGTSF